jgi:hypothetical protein
MEKRSRTDGKKPTKGGETERKRRKENWEKKKRYTIKLSSNLRFIRYGSCNLLSLIHYDLGTEKMKKNHEGMPRIFTPTVKET